MSSKSLHVVYDMPFVRNFHEGEYECTAKNDIGTAQKTAKLEVYGTFRIYSKYLRSYPGVLILKSGSLIRC